MAFAVEAAVEEDGEGEGEAVGAAVVRKDNNSNNNNNHLYLYSCLTIISNDNRTEWSTIQEVIKSSKYLSDLKLRAQLPLNCTTRSPINNSSYQ